MIFCMIRDAAFELGKWEALKNGEVKAAFDRGMIEGLPNGKEGDIKQEWDCWIDLGHLEEGQAGQNPCI